MSGRVAVIGCGNISRAYAEKLSSLPDLELVACADLDMERARDFATRYGVAVVGTPDSIISHPDVDVVLNLTVPVAHAGVTRAALQAGKHVYSEKPLAIDYAEGRAMVDLARRHERRLGCAPDTFLGAGLQTCRGLIDSGAIGTPLAANAFFQDQDRSPGTPTPHSSTSAVQVPCSMSGCTT